MFMSFIVDPVSNTSDAGGSGGGPSNTQTPVAPQQDHSGQSQDNQASVSNEALPSRFDYTALGNKIENQVEAVFAQRQRDIDSSPYHPNGKPKRVSQVVKIYEINVNKQDRKALKELAYKSNFPTQFTSFFNTINKNSISDASIFNPVYRYDLIEYIKRYNDRN